MRCQYRFKEGDKKVLSGEVKVGDQCAGLRASEKSHGLCGGHLRQYNRLNDPEYNRKIYEKQKISLKKSRDKAKQTNKEIVENSREILGEQTYGILKRMAAPKEIDLVREYLILKNLKQDPTQENYAEKYAFALWLNAPEQSRTPKDLAEVAKILGVTDFTLGVWRRSADIVRITTEDTKQTALRDYNYVWEKVMEGVARGDKGFSDMALKHIKELLAANDVGGKAADLPQHLKEEAAKICEASAISRATGVVSKAQKATNYDALMAGDIKPNGETIQ